MKGRKKKCAATIDENKTKEINKKEKTKKRNDFQQLYANLKRRKNVFWMQRNKEPTRLYGSSSYITKDEG